MTQAGPRSAGPGLAFDASRLRAPRRRRFNWRRLLAAVAVLYAASLVTRQVAAYDRLQRQLAAVHRRLAVTEADNTTLRVEAGTLASSSYVKQEARAQLGLVPAGEVPFQPVQR